MRSNPRVPFRLQIGVVAIFALAVGSASCSERREVSAPPSPSPRPLGSSATQSALAVDTSPSLGTLDASVGTTNDAGPPVPDRRRWSFAEAADVLAPGSAPEPRGADCAAASDPVVCLMDRLYAKDDAARTMAKALFARTGTLAGIHEADRLDGGFRGNIVIVPEAPVGAYRKHLEWTAAALDDFDGLFAALAGRNADAPHTTRYRWRGLSLKFFRSVDRTTPSAFAVDWAVAYNVKGTLLTSGDAVRETLFHEIFHLNDVARRDWSRRALSRDYDAIVKRCGTNLSCLAPYAPGDTKVRGGTYYAFQPNNGIPVREYGAELALRWYREHRALVKGTTVPRGARFKCGPPENGRVWKLIVEEFFGFDEVPACER